MRSRPDRILGLSSLGLPELSSTTGHCRNLFSPGPTTVLSPVTNLALDMDNLAGLGRFVTAPTCWRWRQKDRLASKPAPVSSIHGSFPPRSQYDTPKRRNPPLEKVPSFASDVSSDAGELSRNVYFSSQSLVSCSGGLWGPLGAFGGLCFATSVLIGPESPPPGLGLDPPSPIDAVEMEDT